MAALPDYRHFMLPLLRALATRPDGLPRRTAFLAVATAEKLTEEQLGLTLPSGEPTYRNRIAWANDGLKRFGFSSSPRRGHWRITPDGVKFLAQHQGTKAEKRLLELNRQVRQAMTRERPELELAGQEGEIDTRGAATADERIASGIEEIQGRVSQEVLERLKDVDPTVFEKLVLQVLHAMGYGAELEHVRHTGKSGDGGIDGVIFLDHLGLQRVYVQAKRFNSNAVSVDEVTQFFGSVAGEKASMGVFITTSTFTKPAREFGKKSGLALIEGIMLADLMVKFAVGVTHETRLIPKLDEDFFEV